MASPSLLLAVYAGSPGHARTGGGLEPQARAPVASIDSLPDSSYPGLGSAAEQPPAVTRQTHRCFAVTEFGAIPDDGLSDRDAVELAIAAAEARNGFPVVWFPTGRFLLLGPDDVGAVGIRIRRKEVVLKEASVRNRSSIQRQSPSATSCA